MKVSITLPTPPSRDYEITIDTLPKITIGGKAAIVTNPKVAGLHLQRLLTALDAEELYVVTIPDGENYKTMETVEFILDRLFDHRLDRKSTLIAFGGGVIGDMTGFAAAIFQRGIDFIQIRPRCFRRSMPALEGKPVSTTASGKVLSVHFISRVPSISILSG